MPDDRLPISLSESDDFVAQSCPLTLFFQRALHRSFFKHEKPVCEIRVETSKVILKRKLGCPNCAKT